MDAEGDGLKMLQRTLGGYACHPNFAGVLIIGLGCETNQIPRLLATQGLAESPGLRTFTIQDSGAPSTIRKGIELIRDMLPQANAVRRQAVPASHLRLGLQCGGSDGYSGISANPVLGAAVDLLVQHGGTAILSETPEIYGAEHLLTRRAQTPDIGRKLIERIRWWEEYCARNGASMDNNPSSGNKAGGLTTVLEKSLGGIAKAGSTNLVEVYQYAEPVRAHGLVFMDTPGYDPVSATGQVAGGANLICFTTGRGSAYGCAPAPLQAGHQHRPVAPAGRRHGPELRRCAGRHARHRRTGRDPVRATACNRFRRAVAQRTPWIWTTGIRALANQRDHLIPPSSLIGIP